MSKLSTSGFSHPESLIHVKWYILARWFLIPALTLPALTVLLVSDGWRGDTISDAIFVAVSILSNIIFYVFSLKKDRSARYSLILAGLIIMADILLITYFIHTKGGVESRSVILYVLPILVSLVLIGRYAIYATTLGVLICYSAVIWLDYFGVLPSIGGLVLSLHTDGGYVINSMIFIGSVLMIVAVVADFISQLLIKEKQTALKNYESLSRAQAITRLGSWEYDAIKNTASWSPEMRSIFRVSPDKPCPDFEHFIDKFYQEDQKILKRKLKRALSQKSTIRVDSRMEIGGNLHYIRTEAASAVNSKGEVVGLFGTSQDITEAKMLDTAKNDFISLSSHQLRTPATVVKQYLDMLIDGYAGPLNEQQLKFARSAYEGNERQLITINDLLAVVQIDSGQMMLDKTKTDLVQLIAAVVASRAQSFDKKHQKLVFKHRRKEVICNVDLERMRLVIENLIDNASQYSPPQTTTTVSLAIVNKYVRITVQDQGVGMSKKDTTRIFQKFVRVKNSLSVAAGGSGLGLYWTKKVVRLHKGRISVKSTPGKGTTFRVYIPEG